MRGVVAIVTDAVAIAGWVGTATAGSGWWGTMMVMNAANEHTDHELVVAADGSIPADQLARLGVAPGAHLRVVEAIPARSGGSFAGSLPDFPDLTWEDFERASQLAQHDLSSA
jgi:hypothetical protein